MKKCWSWEPFCEEIAKLITRINLEEADSTRVHMLSKPVVLDGIMFRARGHALRLQAGKGEGANVVLMNFDVHAGNRRNFKPNSKAQFANQINNWEEVFA